VSDFRAIMALLFDEYNIKDFRISHQSFDHMEIDLRLPDNERK
jgi:hypothetical protein